MQQKTIWIIYMILGISLNSCKRTVDPVQIGTFVYVNKLSLPIKIKITKTYYKVSTEYEIASSDSLTFIDYGDVIAVPFNAVNGNGDLVTINFENGKCTKYKKDLSPGNYEGTGVFNLKNYNNYSKELVSRKQYRLSYYISDKDLKIAENCD